MPPSEFGAVAVALGTPSVLVGLTLRQAEEEIYVLPMREDGLISREFVVAAPHEVIPLRAWPPIDDGYPMLSRSTPVTISDEVAGKTNLRFAGYSVMYVPDEHRSSAPGTIVLARTYVNIVLGSNETVQGITTPVDIGDLIAPEIMAQDLEQRRAL